MIRWLTLALHLAVAGLKSRQSLLLEILVTGKNLIWGENTGLLRYFPESSAA